MVFKNYYEILQIPSNADKTTIKRVYRELAIQYHPDKYNDDDTKFKEITEAYEMLKNDNSRMDYDNKYFAFDTDFFNQILNKDLYKILQMQEYDDNGNIIIDNYNNDDITNAYNKLAKDYLENNQPDYSKFLEIEEAYKILKDSLYRQTYNLSREVNDQFRKVNDQSRKFNDSNTASRREIYFQNVMYYTFLFLALILIISVFKNIIYSTDKTKKHLKHNSLSKSSHKK